MAPYTAINQTAFTDSPPGKQLIGKEKGARPQRAIATKDRFNETTDTRKEEGNGNKKKLIKSLGVLRTYLLLNGG